jgi:mannose/fructose/N-acetylgalactosamine-specific phosphotransferase system component IIC
VRRLNPLLNGLLVVVLALLGVSFLVVTHGYGPWLGLAALPIAAAVFFRQRWGYFASAVWALAGYQLARQGFLVEVERLAMVLVIPLVALSIYLHEQFARKSAPKQGRRNM